MRIAKIALMAGFLFTLAVANIQVASAAGQTLAGIPTLHDGYWLEKIKDQTQVVYPYEREQCDGPLTCSHPDELYRGGGFVALTAGGQWIQVSCPATTSVGIQLRGDDNDGWVRVSVDDHDIVVWEGNTYGHGNGGALWIKYLEISGLEESSHTVRIAATGRPGTSGGDVHVAIVGFACNTALSEGGFTAYLPMINK